MPNSARTSVHTQKPSITAIFSKANAIAALLSVHHILPSDDAAATLVTCAGLAAEAAAELTALIGGAA